MMPVSDPNFVHEPIAPTRPLRTRTWLAVLQLTVLLRLRLVDRRQVFARFHLDDVTEALVWNYHENNALQCTGIMRCSNKAKQSFR